MVMSLASACLAAITLEGVAGSGLVATCELDTNNPRLGDPVQLSVCFRADGDFDFESLHPPKIASAFDAGDWRVDDSNVRTETLRMIPRNEDSAIVGRVFTYDVRPMKDGLTSIPALEFAYSNVVEGAVGTVVSEPVPVHVRPGASVVLVERESATVALPQPDGLFVNLEASPWRSAEGLSEDDLFAWRKACLAPTAEAFASFAFPEARFNEAACETLAGNWSRALALYAKLEWQVGQTPTLERGIVAALACKENSPSVELPVWRQVFRPILRFALWGRVLAVLAALLAVGLLTWGVRRLVRAFAAVALVLAVSVGTARAADPFAEMEQMRRLMDRQMQQMMNGSFPSFGGGFPSFGGGMNLVVNGTPVPEAEIRARVLLEHPEQSVSAPFDIVLELEAPKDCTLERLRLSAAQDVGLEIAGAAVPLTDGQSDNPSNQVRRLSVPVRCTLPFKGPLTFELSGTCTRRMRVETGRGRYMNSTSSTSFQAETPPVAFDVSTPGEGRPEDYSGAVGVRFRLRQSADRTQVRTNDVVTLSCRLDYAGYLPSELRAKGRLYADERGRTWMEFRRYFVADGAPETDGFSLSYYDAEKRAYATVSCPGVVLGYVSDDEEQGPTVVDAVAEDADGGELVKVRFAPFESAAEIGTVPCRAESLKVTETSGRWVRVDDGRMAGWIKKEELP